MFSNDQNVETIGQLVEEIKRYLNQQTEFVKLDIIEKVVRLITALTLVSIIAIVIMFVLIFASFALAHALGSLIGLGWAYLIVAAVYILALILLVVYRHRWIERPMVKFLASLFLES